jgi:hypothetical protein
MGRTTELRRELRKRFIPLATSKGFALSEANAPFSWEFRRVVGGDEQSFDIQWEKYGRPRFVVNFSSRGRCGRLQPGSGTGTSSWFRQDPTILDRLLLRAALRAPAEVVDELIALFSELEQFFSEGLVGKHVRLFPWASAD